MIAVSDQLPAVGATGIAPTTLVSGVLGAGATAASMVVTAPTGIVAGTSSYDVSTRTVSFTPTEPFAWSTLFTVTVSATGASVSNPSWSFTTVAKPVVLDAVTIFGDALPQHPWWDDTDGAQVATRFSVDVAGQATGVRFYKGSANTGDHTGYLWDSTGAKLAEVTFIDETADGWQTAKFAEPVALVAGIEYRVGLYSTTGRYAVDLGVFAWPTTAGHFSIPAQGSSYVYSREFPAALSTNKYWVDVTFVPAG